MPTSPSFHAGVTPDRVVDAASDLTRESGLFSWSIRDLAKRLGVSPSVIYHHVGGKDLLCRRVVERAMAELPVPDPALPWQDWFRELLFSAVPVAHRYPGVARWLVMHGPTIPAALPMIEAGIESLRRAGFGDAIGSAYGVLLNNAMLTLSVHDERQQLEEDGPRDHVAMLQEFAHLAAPGPGLETLTRTLLAPYARGGEDAQSARAAYYRFNVETTIAGLESWLETAGAPTRTPRRPA